LLDPIEAYISSEEWFRRAADSCAAFALATAE
jgi:hypothetical protein